MFELTWNDIPTDHRGRYNRTQIIDQLITTLPQGFSDWKDRPFVTVYSGSRKGADPIYIEMALELGQGFEDRGFVVVNGGGDGDPYSSLMAAVLHPVSRRFCITPALFAKKTGAGENEGLNDGAINIVTRDYGERKTLMTLLSSGLFFVLPGGYGSIDEGGEGVIHASKTGGHVYFVNPNDYWANLRGQYSFFGAQGLMPRNYQHHYSFYPNPKIVLAHADTWLTQQQPIYVVPNEAPVQEHPAKPAVSARYEMETNKAAITGQIMDFLDQDGWNGTAAQRVGLLISSNIAGESGNFDIQNSSLRAEFVAKVEHMAHELGSQKAVVILSGERKGLRKRAAQAVTEAGGKVIWIKKGETQKPIAIKKDKYHRNELFLTTARHFEKERLFAWLSQSYGVVAGGFHTLNEMMTHITRIQTGHGHYCDLQEGSTNKDFWQKILGQNPPRRTVYLFDPVFNNEGFSLYSPIRHQFQVIANEAFMDCRPDKNDLTVVKTMTNPVQMARAVLDDTDRYPDLFLALAESALQENMNRPASTPVATGKDGPTPKPA